jgi:hypothetical protein
VYAFVAPLSRDFNRATRPAMRSKGDPCHRARWSGRLRGLARIFATRP